MFSSPDESETSARDIYTNCLTEQLSELELLKSMYPNRDEVIVTDINVLRNITAFLDTKSEYTPNHLDYTVNVLVGVIKLEMCVNLPTLYPKEEPDIYVRCNQLNRHQESKMNLELSNYIKSNHMGEVCLFTAICWLQDNIDTFISQNIDVKLGENEEVCNSNDKFVRLWIYSHHIYNKKKRDEILAKAKELKLTGFCLPGKPGIVCIEGPDSNCNKWWKDIKSMCWKKIVIRNTESFELSEQEAQQKFAHFEELHFKNPAGRSSKLKKVLEKHGLIQAFNDIFGFSNDI